MIKPDFKKTPTLLVGASLLLLVLLAGYIYFLFIIFETNKNLRILGEEVLLQSKREEHFRSMKKILGETKNERLELNSRFVSSDNVVSFIENIENLSSVTGVSLDVRSVNIIETTSTVNYEWLELSVDVSGSWKGLYHLFSLVDHLPVASSVSGARIVYTNTDEDSGEEVWSGSFRMKAAKLKEN